MLWLRAVGYFSKDMGAEALRLSCQVWEALAIQNGQSCAGVGLICLKEFDDTQHVIAYIFSNREAMQW